MGTEEENKKDKYETSSSKILLSTSYVGSGKNLLIASLIVMSVTSYYQLLSKDTVVLPIHVGERDTRIITTDKDPILQKEMVNFILSFIDTYYSYSNENVGEKMNLATDLMSDKWFKVVRNNVLEKTKKIQSRAYSQNAKVLKIVRENSGDYNIEILVTGKSRLSNIEQKYRLTLLIDRARRTQTNKWGLEVAYAKESRI